MNTQEPQENRMEFGPETGKRDSWQTPSESEMAGAEAAGMSFSQKPKQLNRSTLIILLSCGIGVLGIYLFSLRHKPKLASEHEKAVEAQVDQALARFMDVEQQQKTNELFEDTKEMVQIFYEYPAKQQVAVNELQRNPFSLMLARQEQTDDLNQSYMNEQRLRRELGKKLDQMKLQSVLRSTSGNKCLVDGEIYQVGSIIADTFKVKKIADESVTLVAHDLEFVLTM